MKKSKKILAVVFAIAMLFTSIPMSAINVDTAFATKSSALEASGQCGENAFWSFDETTGKLTISGSGDMLNYANEYSPFSNSGNIKIVVIEEGVTSIGAFAFVGCTGLTSVTISDSVISIAGKAFMDCTGLASVIIPNSVTSIGDFAFMGCTGLTSITIPDSVISIDNKAFMNCTKLTSVTIPDSATSIGDFVFLGCECLTKIEVGSGNTNYSCDERGVLFDKGKTTLIQYPIGNTSTLYSIPNSVTSIGSYAFSGCKDLTSIVIPNGVTSIGFRAFIACTGLTSVTIPNSVTSIGGYAFYECTGLTDVYFTGTEEQWEKIEIGVSNDALTGATIHFTSAEETLGDPNGDGAVNSADALMVLQFAVEKIDLTTSQFALADVNKDSRVNSNDALMILQYVVKIIEHF